MRDVIVASCDTSYFRQFGSAFINSAVANDNAVHVHVIEAALDEFELVVHPAVSYSFETHAGADRTYFACNRFFIAPKILLALDSPDGRILILDIDSVVRSKVSFPEGDVGLYFRDPFTRDSWTTRGTRVAAGCVLYSRSGLAFAERVSEKINELPSDWLVDQVALAEVFDEMQGSMRVVDLSQPNPLIDWNFESSSPIWTGKGPRKYQSAQYLEEVARWQQCTVGPLVPRRQAFSGS